MNLSGLYEFSDIVSNTPIEGEEGKVRAEVLILTTPVGRALLGFSSMCMHTSRMRQSSSRSSDQNPWIRIGC